MTLTTFISRDVERQASVGKRFAVAIVLTLLLSGPGVEVHACSFGDLGHCIQNAIENAANSIGPKARDSFTSAMNTVFKNDLEPLIDKVDALLTANEKRTQDILNATIQEVWQATDAMIDKAASEAEKLVGNITRSTQIIIHTAESAVQDILNTFFKDVSNVLVTIQKIVNSIDCLEDAAAEDLTHEIEAKINGHSTLPPQTTWCWKNSSLAPSRSVKSLDTGEQYSLLKCYKLQALTPDTSVQILIRTYSDGQADAGQFRCIGESKSGGSAPAFKAYMTREWIQWGEWYDIWSRYQSSQSLNLESEKRNMTLPSRTLRNNSKVTNRQTTATISGGVTTIALEKPSMNNFDIQRPTSTPEAPSEPKGLSRYQPREKSMIQVEIDQRSLGTDYPCGTAFQCFQEATNKCENAEKSCDATAESIRDSENDLETRVNEENSQLNQSQLLLEKQVDALQVQLTSLSDEVSALKKDTFQKSQLELVHKQCNIPSTPGSCDATCPEGKEVVSCGYYGVNLCSENNYFISGPVVEKRNVCQTYSPNCRVWEIYLWCA